VPQTEQCPFCNAPHQYLYYNDGKLRTQLRCKVCSSVFQADNRSQRALKAKYFCPYCQHALFRWKTLLHVIIHKCCNDNCPHRLDAINRLNPAEKLLQRTKSSQFKLCYTYREYLFQAADLVHPGPFKPLVDINRIHNSQNILGLILSFYVSFAISARKTAFILQNVFNISVSYQTVLNYAEAAAYHCHRFNMKFKGPVDDTSAGDETYIKILGDWAYVFLFISSKNLVLSAYHLAHSRETLPAIVTMTEAIRTAQPEQKITLISDGNPSYPAGIHFMNEKRPEELPRIQHHAVIGLQNLDKESETYRAFKQLIERLNRTFKFHVRPASGFKSDNGALSLIVLFATHYNFLRPHISLGYETPVVVPDLQDISTMQGKWIKILSMAG
jgi:putative transposase